ncbi:DUF6431 domain-containing protein [Peptoclostridium acidaminophilum]|uniref:DUF6431 domain-containing protein n=1 Tax=Peptoclostridium acidaminophilum TaxID=1731 RepID=UPI0038CDA400
MCEGTLSVRDTRKRHVIGQDGSRRTYRLRRLKCTACGKLHIELPKCMLPFKHYEASAIETAIDQSRSDCPADDSTINRWKRAFNAVLPQIEGALRACWTSHESRHFPLLNRISLLHYIRLEGPGWLAFVHYLLSKTGIWLHTYFACCP